MLWLPLHRKSEAQPFPLIIQLMNKEKAERITLIYNWLRVIIIGTIIAFMFAGVANAQTVTPEIHGILRGKSGFTKDSNSNPTSTLALTDAERHRMTIGATLSLRNPAFPTDLRLNYEKYHYPHDNAKESETDKLVCELMIRF